MRNQICLCLLAALLGITAVAQQVTPANGVTYDWPAVTTTGQLGSYLYQYQGGVTSGSSNFTIDWGLTGTAPATCTFRIEGSSDAVAWTGLDATSPAVDSAPCTSSNMLHIADKPVRFLRVYIVAFTGSDATTKLIFHYTRGAL